MQNTVLVNVKLEYIRRIPLKDIVYVALLVAICLFAFRIAAPQRIQDIQVWGHNFSSAVNYACNQIFAEVSKPDPALVDFLRQRENAFDCKLLPPTVETKPLNPYARGASYFLRGLGIYWRFTGVSWFSLTPLIGSFFLLTSIAVFLLFRQFTRATIAFLCASLFMISPVHLSMLSWYEHYTKIPIFFAAATLMVTLVRRTLSRTAVIAFGALGGILLGIGIGIRADLWLLSVPFVVAILLLAKCPLTIRLAAFLAFTAFAMIMAWPAIIQSGKSYFWLQLIVGLASPFTQDLRLQPSIYDWLPVYSDFIGNLWLQTFYYYQIDGGSSTALDSVSVSLPPAALGLQKQEIAGMRSYFAIMSYFPADFVMRPIAATLTIISNSFRTQAVYLSHLQNSSLYGPAVPIWKLAGPLGFVLPLVLMAELFGLALRRLSKSLFYLFFIVFTGGVTAVVFIDRHHWHLYVIGFLTLAIALQFLASACEKSRRPLDARVYGSNAVLRMAAWFGLLIAVGLLWIAGLVWFQEKRVGSLVQTLLNAPAEILSLSKETDGLQSITVWNAQADERFQQQRQRTKSFQYTQYYSAIFLREGCGTAVQVVVTYETNNPRLAYEQTIDLNFAEGSKQMFFLFPGYFWKSDKNFFYIRGVRIRGGTDECVTTLARIREPSKLPFLIVWRIPENWRNLPLNQTLEPDLFRP